MFLLVPAYPGCPGSKAVKRSLLLLLFNYREGQKAYIMFLDCQYVCAYICSYALSIQAEVFFNRLAVDF